LLGAPFVTSVVFGFTPFLRRLASFAFSILGLLKDHVIAFSVLLSPLLAFVGLHLKSVALLDVFFTAIIARVLAITTETSWFDDSHLLPAFHTYTTAEAFNWTHYLASIAKFVARVLHFQLLHPLGCPFLFPFLHHDANAKTVICSF
jgi:hypothetical protein